MIVCQNCGSIDDYNERAAGPHISAYCNGCGKYIKHLPQNTPATLYFGKYRGRLISSMLDIEELRYLEWLTNAGGIKPKLKEAIDAHLKAL